MKMPLFEISEIYLDANLKVWRKSKSIGQKRHTQMCLSIDFYKKLKCCDPFPTKSKVNEVKRNMGNNDLSPSNHTRVHVFIFF